MSDFGLLGCCTPTATLDSEIQPTVKGRRTSLSILSLISSSNTNADAEGERELVVVKLGIGFGLL